MEENKHVSHMQKKLCLEWWLWCFGGQICIRNYGLLFVLAGMEVFAGISVWQPLELQELQIVEERSCLRENPTWGLVSSYLEPRICA